MKHKMSKKLISLLVAFAMVLTMSAAAFMDNGGQPADGSLTLAAAGDIYYVDSVGGNDANDGLSQANAWKTIANVNRAAGFLPGETILFKRGGVYEGNLAPQGSGNADAWISIGAYGDGDLPLILAPSGFGEAVGSRFPDSYEGGTAALQLVNQEYWKIDSLEVAGGTQWGIRVTADAPGKIFTGFEITNCVVRDVYNGMYRADSNVPFTDPRPYTYRNSGLIIFYIWDKAGAPVPGEIETQFSDILIENNVVHGTNQFNGIGVWGNIRGDSFTENVVLRNNVAYDTFGVGIHMAGTQHTIAEYNLAYNNAIWDGTGIELWRTRDVVWQYNEAFNTHAGRTENRGDLGAFDIDYYCYDVMMQYNYGHDAAGYGVSIFSAFSSGDPSYYRTAKRIDVRYNIFSNNMRQSLSQDQGSVFISSWSNGNFEDVRVYNNTIYHNPVKVAQPAIWCQGTYVAGSTNYVMNNLIYSEVPTMYRLLNATSPLITENNLYYCTTGEPLQFRFGSTNRDWNYITNTMGRDLDSFEIDPLLVDPTFHGTGVGAAGAAFTPSMLSPAKNAGADLIALDMFTSLSPIESTYDNNLIYFGEEYEIKVAKAAPMDYIGTPMPQGGAYDIGAIEIPVPAVSVTGPASVVSGSGAEARYIISAANMPMVSAIDLEFEVDGDFLSSKEFNALDGFEFFSDGNYGTEFLWTNIGNKWIAKAILLNPAGISGDFDIVELAFNATEGMLGTTDVVLNSVTVSYAGMPVGTYIEKGVASTLFEQWYSPYDLNKDGVIDLNDLTFALQFLLITSSDPEWAQAYVCDFDPDGEININDLIMILANYTIPYYS